MLRANVVSTADERGAAAALLINPPISANRKMVQERLGHSSIQVTFDRYGHPFPGLDEDLEVALDSIFSGHVCERA